MKTRRHKRTQPIAVAVFDTPLVKGEVIAQPCTSGKGIDLIATFRSLPTGKHGFHIHKAGDMRGKGCVGLCEHYDKGKNSHGAGPHTKKGRRHTGDLGNLVGKGHHRTVTRRYCLEDVSVQELWGRSIIVHEDEDDLGKGPHEDSATTGHSGARMACAIFGRGCFGR
jgi:Cu-Zn family superoxide dismutase